MNFIFDNQGFTRYWAQGDSLSHAVAYALLAMSLISWYFILGKTWSALRIRRSAKALDAFWNAPTVSDAIALLQYADGENVYAPLAVHSAEAARLSAQTAGAAPTLNAEFEPGELMTRTLRQQINRASAKLESGQTFLASIGATSPFVGLLGTVWGIYNSLAAISSAGMLQIDKVAGPIGEALIMTAMGLAVAIPAVLAYNAFARINRITLAELDAFAHDLRAYFTTGTRSAKS